MLAIVKMQWRLKELFLKMRIFCREETPQTPIYVLKKVLNCKDMGESRKKTPKPRICVGEDMKP